MNKRPLAAARSDDDDDTEEAPPVLNSPIKRWKIFERFLEKFVGGGCVVRTRRAVVGEGGIPS